MVTTLNLSKIPPEELARMPARVPPPGIVPNLVHPYTVGNYIVTATSVLMSIMMVLLTLRFYVVFTIKKRMAPDDWAVVAGSIGCCYYFIVTCICKVNLSDARAIMRLTCAQAIKVMKYGTHMWDLSIPDVWSRDAAIVSCFLIIQYTKLICGLDRFYGEYSWTHHLALHQDYILPHVPSTLPPSYMAPPLRVYWSRCSVGILCGGRPGTISHYGSTSRLRMVRIIRITGIHEDFQALCTYSIVQPGI